MHAFRLALLFFSVTKPFICFFLYEFIFIIILLVLLVVDYLEDRWHASGQHREHSARANALKGLCVCEEASAAIRYRCQRTYVLAEPRKFACTPV